MKSNLNFPSPMQSYESHLQFYLAIILHTESNTEIEVKKFLIILGYFQASPLIN